MHSPDPPAPHALGVEPCALSSCKALRILVVDDEPLIRWSITETLRGSGHWVTTAESAGAALRTLVHSTEPVDLVLLDYCLPDSRGLGLLANIRRVSPGSAVIMITCDSTPEMIDGALALGAARVVSKPFDLDDLPTLVQDAYSSHRA